MLDEQRFANTGILKTKVYVPGKSADDVMRELGIKNAVKLSSNENPLGTSPKALDAFTGCAKGIHRYPDGDSRNLIAGIAKKYGCNNAEITIGCGADGVIYNLSMALIDQDDEIIIPGITFPVYETAAHIMRGKVVKPAMKDLNIDLDAVKKAVTNKTKIIYLCNPNNPTGAVLPVDQIVSFLKGIPENILIVIDEAYIEFTPREDVPPSLELFRGGMRNLFIIRTFSKLYGLAGLRVGYGIGDETIISLINRIRPPFDVSVPAQTAALAAMDDTAFAAKTLEECRLGKEMLYRGLEDLGIRYVRSGTNFILIETGDAADTCDVLIRKGLIVRSAAGYGLPDWIRMTLGREEDNRRFLDALKEMKK